LDIAEVGGIPINATDLIGTGIPSKLALGVKAFGPAIAAALGGTAIASRASEGAKLNSLARILRGQRGVMAGPQAKTEFELAHEVAQRNAALPVEQGGLGLPANNTAMDRAKAMGFDTPAYHGSKYGMEGDFISDKGYIGKTFLTDDKQIASKYAEGKTPTGDNNSFIDNNLDPEGYVLPLKVRVKKPINEDTLLDDIYGEEKAAELRNDEFIYDPKPFSSSIEDGTDLSILAHLYAQFPKARENIKSKGYDGFRFNDLESGGITTTPFESSQIRSRFAAFDPMKRNSANILAGGAAGGIGVNALYDLMNQEEYQ
jgi:hypothetical protein